jgi:hypothetical protein
VVGAKHRPRCAVGERTPCTQYKRDSVDPEPVWARRLQGTFSAFVGIEPRSSSPQSDSILTVLRNTASLYLTGHLQAQTTNPASHSYFVSHRGLFVFFKSQMICLKLADCRFVCGAMV